MSNQTRISRILSNFAELSGTKFVGIKEYISVKTGEVANFVVNANFSYANAIINTIAILKTLTSVDFTAIAEKYNVVNYAGTQYATNAGAVKYLTTGKLPKEGTKARETVLKGVKETKTLATIVAEMIETFNKNQDEDTRSPQSIKQREIYKHLENGVKQHRENKTYHIWAMSHSKQVILAGEYKDSEMGIEAAQKNAIERYCKDVLGKQLPTTKYRNFVVEDNQLSEVNVNGETVEFID